MTRATDRERWQQVLAIVGQTMARNPSVSINRLARACVDANVQVSKDLVMQARKVVRKSVQQTGVDAPVLSNGDRIVVVVDPLHRRPAPTVIPTKTVLLDVETPDADDVEKDVEKDTKVEEPAVAHVAAEPEQKAEPTPVKEVMTPEKPDRRLAQTRAEKRQFVNDQLDADPGLDPIVLLGRLREKFGSALSNSYVYDTCRVARELHQLPQLSTTTAHTRKDVNGRTSLPAFGVAPDAPELEPKEGEEFAATPEEDLHWLAMQASDIMRAHQLAELTLTLSPAGGDWEFKVTRTGRGTLKF